MHIQKYYQEWGNHHKCIFIWAESVMENNNRIIEEPMRSEAPAAPCSNMSYSLQAQ